MSSNNKIEIEELQKAVNILFNHLRNGGVRQIELGKDYYWELDANELYQVKDKVSDLSVGSLFDDWESIQQLANGESVPVVLHFLKVAPLLRYLGDNITEVQLISPSESED